MKVIPITMKLGELRRQLAAYSDDHDVFFSGGSLSFFRLKLRGPKLLQIEFDQQVMKLDGKWTVLE